MTKTMNLKKATRAYILKEIDREQFENVILSRINEYTWDSEEKKMRIYKNWFEMPFDSLEENYRDYYWKHEEEWEWLLNLLVDDWYEFLNKTWKSFYNKILN